MRAVDAVQTAREAQGLPPVLSDEAVIDRVVAVLLGSRSAGVLTPRAEGVRHG